MKRLVLLALVSCGRSVSPAEVLCISPGVYRATAQRTYTLLECGSLPTSLSGELTFDKDGVVVPPKVAAFVACKTDGCKVECSAPALSAFAACRISGADAGTYTATCSSVIGFRCHADGVVVLERK
jgi:hypothetical protein